MIPKNVDCIILGTGLTNSILAAACSRIGKSVLHVDKNGYYGNQWASFTFHQLIDWIKINYPNDKCLDSIPDELNSKSRMFCLDLCPKLLYSNGSMVELLVKSNVSRYHEFKNNIRILSMIDNAIHVMPCKRSDVFTSPLLSDLVDKRRLMKFIELCVKFDPDDDGPEAKEVSENSTKPIMDYLTEKKLKHPLREYIINSIAMVKPTDPLIEVCAKIKNFMVAIERFGRSPFLYPLYGCGEFPQSFCRLSAVFGGLYCLNTSIDAIECNRKETNESPTTDPINTFVVKFSNNEYKVESNALVLDCNFASDQDLTTAPVIEQKLSRAILITNKSVVDNSENLISFLRIPAGRQHSEVIYLLEVNSSVMVCPLGINILYLWTKSSSELPDQDLEPTIRSLFNDDTSPIMWKFYYHQLSESEDGLDRASSGLEGLYITGPPSNDIDYTHSIKEAERIFRRICPDEEFLPRAPDPDEIKSQE